MVGSSQLTKTELAKKLGISRALLYYKHKRPALDEEVKQQIESVWTKHPAYGHKRLALALKLNKKRILRVMKKFGMKPYRRRLSKPIKIADLGKPALAVVNVSKLLCPLAPNIVWVGDFTYIRFQEKFIYFATIMDQFTREIVGWNISRYHNSELVVGALEDAFKRRTHVPVYLHSDQGSEYDSQMYQNTLKQLGIQLSMSDKGSPWQNGFQESFYSHFKLDLGRTDRFEHLGELGAALHQAVLYYNEERLHSVLKMTPKAFAQLNTRNHLSTDNTPSLLGT
jgi:transposase InsO family protein